MLRGSAVPLNVEYMRTIFWHRVDVAGPTDCWLWKQSVGSHGYGQTWDRRTVRLAHRVAWVLTRGEIPTGMTVDHLCHVRKCCNPVHLRLLSNYDNAKDNGMAIRTHCPSGHPYDADNTRRTRVGHRQCRACENERYRDRQA